MLYTMKHKNFTAKIMRAQRLTGDYVHSLPPGSPIPVYPVDAFKCPLSSWVTGAGNYVVPVDPDWGLWFDWRDNDEMNTSVLLSIKGMNPITGQRTNGFGLERYEEKCPIHNEQFKDGLFCEKCNFKWPVQNYVSYPNKLWWDGFRSEDGKVRQFFFTEDLAKSIPELVIGKEDTVPAFGFAFFKTKVSRQIQAPIPVSYILNYVPTGTYVTSSKDYVGQNTTSNYASYRSCGPSSAKARIKSCSMNYSCEDINVTSSKDYRSKSFTDTMNETKKLKLTSEVGVGAGAEIEQDLLVDTLKLSDWEEKPESVMRLFFIFVDQFKEIETKGMKDLIGGKNGFMSGFPVG